MLPVCVSKETPTLGVDTQTVRGPRMGRTCQATQEDLLVTETCNQVLEEHTVLPSPHPPHIHALKIL